MWIFNDDDFHLNYSQMTSSLASRYHHTVDVILEEGSSDDDDFIEQEARIQAELEQHEQARSRQQQDSLSNGSRPPFCEGQEAHKGNAYGEAVDILDQALIACDQEFADHHQNNAVRQQNELPISVNKPTFRPDPR